MMLKEAVTKYAGAAPVDIETARRIARSAGLEPDALRTCEQLGGAWRTRVRKLAFYHEKASFEPDNALGCPLFTDGKYHVRDPETGVRYLLVPALIAFSKNGRGDKLVTVGGVSVG